MEPFDFADFRFGVGSVVRFRAGSGLDVTCRVEAQIAVKTAAGFARYYRVQGVVRGAGSLPEAVWFSWIPEHMLELVERRPAAA